MTLRSFGLRERRQFARHLAHCQPCRMQANLAGVDESLVKPRRLGAKIAALLPFPLWRWPWGGSRAARDAVVRTGSHPAAINSLQSAAVVGEPAGASALGGAAVAAAVLALTGAGAGLAPGAPGHHRGVQPHRASGAPARSTTISSLPAPLTTRAPTLARAGSHKAVRTGHKRVHLTSVFPPGARGPASAPHPSAPQRGAASTTSPAATASRQAAGAGSLPTVSAPGTPTGTPSVPGPAKPLANTLSGPAGATTNAVNKVIGSAPLQGTTGTSGAAGQALGAAQAAGSSAAGAAGSVAAGATGAATSVASRTASSVAGAG